MNIRKTFLKSLIYFIKKMFTISSLKSFIAGFVSVSTFTFVKLRKHSFTEAKIALEKDFMAITRDKNQANYKLKTKHERT